MIAPSQAGQWICCETMALRHPRTEYRMGAAAVVGSWAHRLLTDRSYKPPDRISYDGVTPSLHAAHVQANLLAGEARQLLADRGWAIVDSETPVGRGRADLMCDHPSYGRGLVEFKTGRQLGAAWLQIGAYLDEMSSDVRWGGMLHVPRHPIDKTTEGFLEWRARAVLVAPWRVLRDRIGAVLDGAPPMVTPGGHCSWCPNMECPVRA